MTNAFETRILWAATVVLVAVFAMFGQILPAQAVDYCYGPAGSACVCPVIGEGLTCTGQYMAP
ncbi:hypothetical protein ACFL26_02570, partial [Patescibacteria group bacterium]